MPVADGLRSLLSPSALLRQRAEGWRSLLRLPDGRGQTAGEQTPEPRHRNELEFLPAALEIMETPPSPGGRLLSLTLCAFFVIALGWSCWSRIDIVASATGKVIPVGKTKTIQPLEIGVVHAIHVTEGQTVRTGQPLIDLDPTTSSADRERLSGELMVALTDMARLYAAAEGKEDAYLPPAKAPPALVALSRQLLATQLAEHRSKLVALERQEAQKASDMAAITATISKFDAVLPILRDRVASRKWLWDNNAGSRVAWLELRQDMVEREHERSVQQHRLSEAQAAFQAAQASRRQAEAEFKRTVLGDLNQARDKASSLGQELIKAEQRAAQQTLTSPVAGTVQQLQVTTIGGVVTPAQPLMMIVPEGERLEVEATLQNKDIGFVEPGQAVEIKIDTFNFTRYGLLHGTVLNVSQDAIQRDRPPDGSKAPTTPDLVFTARIALAETRIQVEDKVVPLAPGMAVTAEIRTGTRRVIEYLLSPVLRYHHEAMRER